MDRLLLLQAKAAQLRLDMQSRPPMESQAPAAPETAGSVPAGTPSQPPSFSMPSYLSRAVGRSTAAPSPYLRTRDVAADRFKNWLYGALGSVGSKMHRAYGIDW